MPAIDTSNWDLAVNRKTRDPGDIPADGDDDESDTITIEGSAIDITQPADEQTIDLSTEPDFPIDRSTDRQDPVSDLATWVSRLPHGPLRTLDPKRLNSKAQLFEQLTRTLPLNELNLPIFVYRPDLLDHKSIAQALFQLQPQYGGSKLLTEEEPDLFASQGLYPDAKSGTHQFNLDGSRAQQGSATSTISFPHQAPSASEMNAGYSVEELQSQLESATIQLEYHEGFPALPGGQPFWRRMDVETEEAFDAFVSYLELGGARRRTDLIAYKMESINEWFHIHFWTYRVKAFELFRVVNHNKERVLRMLRTEDNHFTMADKAMIKIATAFEQFEMKDFHDLGPEKLSKVAETMVKLQRISTGLNVNGGAVDAEDMRRSPSTQVIVQQVVKATGETQTREEDKPDLLRDSPDAVEQAQRLIIQMNNQVDTP